MPVIECDVERVSARLADAGIEVGDGNTAHERWRAEHAEGVAIAYDGKVVIQGPNPHRLAALVRGAGDAGGDDGPDASTGAYCYFDGASRGNPGPAAIGWVIVTDGGIVAEGGSRIDETTNNRAEYEALTRVLEIAREYGFSTVHVRGDSELVVKQVTGQYRTNQPELRERRVTVHELLEGFDDWTIEHVPRAVNDRADANANEALDRD